MFTMFLIALLAADELPSEEVVIAKYREIVEASRPAAISACEDRIKLLESLIVRASKSSEIIPPNSDIVPSAREVFPNAKAKKKAIADRQRLLKAEKERLGGLKDETITPGDTHLSSLKIGAGGILHDDATVLQVIDSENMLVSLSGNRVIWVARFSTKKYVDGMKFFLPERPLLVVGTKMYRTTLRANATVFLVVPVR